MAEPANSVVFYPEKEVVMKNSHFGITQVKRWALIPAVCLLVISLAAGCSSSTKTVRSETLTTPVSQTTVVEKETTHSDGEHHGLLGGALHVVGEILAFPFEVIAGVFRFIF